MGSLQQKEDGGEERRGAQKHTQGEILHAGLCCSCGAVAIDANVC